MSTDHMGMILGMRAMAGNDVSEQALCTQK